MYAAAGQLVLPRTVATTHDGIQAFCPVGNTAEVLCGPRPQKYVELLWTTDLLAEAVMDEFAGMPENEWGALLDLALAKDLVAVPNYLSRVLGV